MSVSESVSPTRNYLCSAGELIAYTHKYAGVIQGYNTDRLLALQNTILENVQCTNFATSTIEAHAFAVQPLLVRDAHIRSKIRGKTNEKTTKTKKEKYKAF